MLEEEPTGQCEMAALRLPVLLLYGGLQSVACHMSQQESESPLIHVNFLLPHLRNKPAQ